MPDELKQVDMPKLVPGAPVNVPDEVASKEFSLDDFEVQQLPVQDEEDKGAEEVKVADKVEDKSVDKAVKEEAKAVKKEEEEVKEEEDDKGTESEVKQDEKKLPAFFKPPQDKKVEETSKAGDKKDASGKPIVPGKVIRDYSGYSPEQVAAFKQMSDGAYKMTTELIKQNKELAEKSNSSLMQHPQAYVLDPTYQQTRTELQRASTEMSYWEQQLVNMDEGKDLIPLKGFDVNTGQPVYGEPMKATKILEEKVRGIIYECNQVSRNLQGKLQEFPTKYQSNIKQDIAGIDDFRKKQFGWVTDESLMDYTIPVEGMGERSLKQIKQDVQSMLPSWSHSHPIASLLGDVVIALRIKQAELAQLTQEAKVSKTKKDEQELVEPSGNAKPSARGKGKPVHGVTEFSIDPSLGV